MFQTIKSGIIECKISSPPNRNAAKTSAVKLTKACRLSGTAVSLIIFDVVSVRNHLLLWRILFSVDFNISPFV